MPTEVDRQQLESLLPLLGDAISIAKDLLDDKLREPLELALDELLITQFDRVRDELRTPAFDLDSRLTAAGLVGRQLEFKFTVLQALVQQVKTAPESKTMRKRLELVLEAAKSLGLSLADAFNLGEAYKELIELTEAALASAVLAGEPIQRVSETIKRVRRRLRRTVTRLRGPDS